jgi:teichoic acid transport system permease protein
MTDVGTTTTDPIDPIAPTHRTDLGDLARAAGLHRVGVRPSLRAYVASLWERRHFAVALASARTYAAHQRGYLGQLWAVLTPLLWAALYLVVFGLVLGVDHGIGNYPVFLVAGLFVHRFLAGALTKAASSLAGHRSLMGSLRFPRALVPVSTTVGELLSFLPALGVLLVVAVVAGEPPRPQLLLLVPAVALAALFATGLALAAARLVDLVTDLKNLVPFVSRALLYTSGVFFSLDHYPEGPVRTVMEHQPWAVFLHLARSAVLESVPLRPDLWAWGAGWAVVVLAGGLVFFWRGEAAYGRG